MKINEKDRSQLLRMAGNIAASLSEQWSDHDEIAEVSAKLAVKTLEAVDKEITERDKDA